jgi:dihydrofolate reductase
MGRKTWDSLPKKPLPKRFHVVISSSFYPDQEFVKFVNNLQDGIDYCKTLQTDTWVIGGGTIYKQCLEEGMIDVLYISKIQGDYDCDVFFPKIPDFYKKSIVLKEF